MTRSDPKSFAASAHLGADELAKTRQHPHLPQRRLTSHVAAVADQPVGVAHVPHAQQIRLPHWRSLCLEELRNRSKTNTKRKEVDDYAKDTGTYGNVGTGSHRDGHSGGACARHPMVWNEPLPWYRTLHGSRRTR